VIIGYKYAELIIDPNFIFLIVASLWLLDGVTVDLPWVAVVLRLVAVNLSLPHTTSILLTRTKLYGYKLIIGYNNAELKTCHDFFCVTVL
jgi:hypothetical protein